MAEAFADAQLEAWAEGSSEPSGEFDVDEMRSGSAERAKVRPKGPEMHEVRDLQVGGLGARLYRPRPDARDLIVYLHGGGWTIGSLNSHDRLCRHLAAGSGAAALAIDYRLAPEHPWPASADDAFAALVWAGRERATLGLDGCFVLAGDSAGGTLATLACIRARDEQPEALPDLQVLMYPNTDLTGSHPSMKEKANGWGLDAALVRFFAAQWVPDERQLSDPAVSPLYAADLRGLPPALVVIAEHDVLRDEGRAYAERLREAGVSVSLRCEPGLVHGFAVLDDISPACAAALNRLLAHLRARLEQEPHLP
jgi:acetyl esterase